MIFYIYIYILQQLNFYNVSYTHIKNLKGSFYAVF